MTPEENEKHNKCRLWVWIAFVVSVFIFAANDSCNKRAENPEMEENAYFLTCDSK